MLNAEAFFNIMVEIVEDSEGDELRYLGAES